MTQRKGLAWRTLVALFLSALLLPTVSRAGDNGDAGSKPIVNLGDLNGKRLGILVGTMLDQAANDVLDYTQIFYYETSEMQLEALLAGEIDAIIDDQPAIRFYCAQDSRFRMLPGLLQEQRFAYAMRPDDTELHREFNAALRELIADGTFAEMERRWFESPGNGQAVMPEIPPHNAPRTLRFGASPVTPPLSYQDPETGQLTGMDVELLHRIAVLLDRRLEVVSMEFGQLFEYLLSGKVDIIGSGLTVTRERKKIVLFSDSYYDSGVSAMVLDSPVHNPRP